MFNQIIHGNHLDVLKWYPDDAFDMFLTSPPYDNLRDYEGYDFQFEPLAHELYRTLNPGGVGVWVVNDATINGSETLTTAKQKIYFKEQCGFNIHDTMIYAKTGCCYTNPSRYLQMFEYVFVLAKGKPLTTNLLQQKSTGHGGYVVYERKKDGSKVKVNTVTGKNKTRTRGNIWLVYQHGKNASSDNLAFQHPAIFPEKLAEDHILSWSNPGDVILDPMCGSGTTCKMAVKHQRQYVGIDISEKYCELARKRIDKFTAQTTIFEVLPSLN